MNIYVLIVILAVLVPLQEASGQLAPVTNIYVGGIMEDAMQDARISELQKQVKHMTAKVAELTSVTGELTKQNRNLTAGLILCKACCNKTFECPDGYHQYLDKCFNISNDEETYDDARAACQAVGGRLAMPKDQEADTFLVDMIKAKVPPPLEVWIGLTDRVQEGKFVWEDNTPLGWANWYPGEPDNSFPSYDCAGWAHNHGYKWSTGKCDASLYSMCEVNARVAP